MGSEFSLSHNPDSVGVPGVPGVPGAPALSPAHVQRDSRPQQAAAVPYRVDPEGDLWVLLVTNSRGEWIVPKGTIEPNRSAEQTALIESLEEAGVTGTLDKAELGRYTYVKGGASLLVAVYSMRVDRVLVRWLEQADREREWFRYVEATERLSRTDLRKLLRVLHDRLAGAAKLSAA